MLLSLAAPLVAICILQDVVNMVSVMFVGHLGELPLATSLTNVTGFSLLVGMASALDTLCGQAFGAGRHRLLGVHKQRAMVVLALVYVPVALIWANAGEILLLVGQDADIAAEAGAYARWTILSLVPYVPLVCHIRFLQAQSVVAPVMASSAATAICHVAVCCALVFKASMGSRGAALSIASPSPWNGGHLNCLCCSLWTSSQSKARNLSVINMGYVYSNEAEVVTYIARMIPVLTISFFRDGIDSSLSGCGKQKIGAQVKLGTFYLVGIPMAVLFAFVLNLNGVGLWLGIVCGSLTKLVLLLSITLRIN
uniref:Protein DETOXIFICATION n=1 Tax=Oryza punctata TaxID=4537 RepID=A0A0E0M6Q2_ORYPU